MEAYLLLESLISLNINRSLEESKWFCSRFMQMFIYL